MLSVLAFVLQNDDTALSHLLLAKVITALCVAKLATMDRLRAVSLEFCLVLCVAMIVYKCVIYRFDTKDVIRWYKDRLCLVAARFTKGNTKREVDVGLGAHRISFRVVPSSTSLCIQSITINISRHFISFFHHIQRPRYHL
jgi:hypothetical protein